MRIYNLRTEIKNKKAYLIADIECSFSASKTLWFNVDEKYSGWLTDDVYDAFLTAAIWPCMCYGENIRIEGLVSKKLYKNLISYIIPVIKQLRPHYNIVEVFVKGYQDAKKDNFKIIGTGFSGGIDSYCSIIDHYINEYDPEYKINTLFFFNIGQYEVKTCEHKSLKALNTFHRCEEISQEIGLPLLYMDSNLFDFYKSHWEYDAGPLCRITSILVFQRVIIRYYISGSFNYFQSREFKKYEYLDDVADHFIYSLLSPNGIEMVIDGDQYYRYEKVIKVDNYPISHKNLHVCVHPQNFIKEEKNCSKCHKCKRTLMTLEAIDKLDDYSEVFDLDLYKRTSFKAKCWAVIKYNTDMYSKENIDFLKAQGKKTPNKIIAWLYLFPSRVKKYLR